MKISLINRLEYRLMLKKALRQKGSLKKGLGMVSESQYETNLMRLRNIETLLNIRKGHDQLSNLYEHQLIEPVAYVTAKAINMANSSIELLCLYQFLGIINKPYLSDEVSSVDVCHLGRLRFTTFSLLSVLDMVGVYIKDLDSENPIHANLLDMISYYDKVMHETPHANSSLEAI